MGPAGISTRTSLSVWRAVQRWKDGCNPINLDLHRKLYLWKCASEQWLFRSKSSSPVTRNFTTCSPWTAERALASPSSDNYRTLHRFYTVYPGYLSTSDRYVQEKSLRRYLSFHAAVVLATRDAIGGEVLLKDGSLGNCADMIVEYADHDPVRELLLETKSERNVSLDALYRRIQKFGTVNGKTVSLIQNYIAEGNKFDKEDAIYVITKLKRHILFRQAAEIMDWLAESQIFPWTSYDLVVRLSLKGKLGQSSEVERIFKHSPLELQTETAYNAVIKHFCERRLMDKAQHWVDLLTKSGQLTHAFAFNRLLVLYKYKQRFQKISEVVEAMKVAGIPKDIYTYNVLISVNSGKKDVRLLEEIFKECKEDPNVEVDAATYATLASSYLEAGLPDKAAAVLEDLERGDYKSRGHIDEVVATLWGKLGYGEKVANIWETLKRKPVIPPRTYAVMIETFGKVGMVDKAESLFIEMEDSLCGVRPRQFTALLSAYVKNGSMDRAERLLGRIGQMGLVPNGVMNHHIVVAYLKMGKLDRALAVLNEAQGKGKGAQPLFTTMVVLLNAVAEKGDVMLAEKLFDALSAAYNQKNQTVFNTLLKAYARAGLPADGFLERMVAANIPPNQETHALLGLCSGIETREESTVGSVEAECDFSGNGSSTTTNTTSVSATEEKLPA